MLVLLGKSLGQRYSPNDETVAIAEDHFLQKHIAYVRNTTYRARQIYWDWCGGNGNRFQTGMGDGVLK